MWATYTMYELKIKQTVTLLEISCHYLNVHMTYLDYNWSYEFKCWQILWICKSKFIKNMGYLYLKRSCFKILIICRSDWFTLLFWDIKLPNVMNYVLYMRYKCLPWINIFNMSQGCTCNAFHVSGWDLWFGEEFCQTAWYMPPASDSWFPWTESVQVCGEDNH